MDAITRPAEGTSPDDAQTYRMPLPRLRLTPDAGHGPLDGAWWPRRDAWELELPALVGSPDPAVGTVTRVTVDTASWPDAPQTVMAPGHVIEVSGPTSPPRRMPSPWTAARWGAGSYW